MSVRYYHGSRGHRYSNGPVLELFYVLGKMTAVAILMALALATWAVAGIAWAVTRGKWHGAKSIAAAGNALASGAMHNAS